MLKNLQILRALAALNVVYFHVIGAATSYRHPVSLFSTFAGWGSNGVDIFFVISGFVMVYTQANNPKSAADFLRNRALRIIPIYWVLTAFFLFLFVAIPTGFRELKPTPLLVVSSFLFTTGVLVGQHPLLYVGWTLEYEVLFYLLFGFGLLAKDRRVALLLPLGALACLVFLGANPIMLEFAFGMVCARLYIGGWGRRWGLLLLAIGAAWFLLTIWYRPHWGRVWVYGVPSALVVLGAVNVRQVRSHLFAYLGDASYSIYLVQVFAIPVSYKLAAHYAGGISPDLLSVGPLVFTVAVGCLVFELVEKPLGRYLKRSIAPRVALA